MTEDDSADRVFIDTNIWIYAFSDAQDKVKTQQARALIRRERNITLNIQVLNETTKNLLQKFGATEDIVQKLIRSIYRKYTVVDFSQQILLQASRLRSTYHFSFWDSTIVASTLDVQAKTLYSEDFHDGLVVEGRVTIINPFK
jgi:predicted nucleic acid-binding protein